MVDKYSWVDVGSSYLMNDLSAAYLWGQLEKADEINNDRLSSWNNYFNGLKELKELNLIDLPSIPVGCVHNAHMFYIKVKNLDTRSSLIQYLKDNGILSVFHYIPLHSSPAGRKFGYFKGQEIYTEKDSQRLLRLPLYFGLDNKLQLKVINTIKEYFNI